MEKAKLNIPVCAALVLLFLTLLTTHITGGLYARYAAQTTGRDTARVARFEIDVTPLQEELTVDCAQTQDGTYGFTVTNNSEVPVRYAVLVTFKQALQGNLLQVALDDGSYSYVGSSNAVSFAVEETLNMLGDSADHALRFRIAPDVLFDSVQGQESIDLGLDFTVTVHAEQID